MKFSSILDETRVMFGSMADAASAVVNPRVRLGVTGLSRAGKTVFITALVHNLVNAARLPLLNVQAEGRITRAYLQPQPNMDLPRFAYEDHVEALTGDGRHWPDSTRRMSELRLTIEYDARGLVARSTHGGKLHIDIVDYPGEWLLDLPLLDMSYSEWSHRTLERSRSPAHRAAAKDWLAHVSAIDPASQADETAVRNAARAFTGFLERSRKDGIGPATLPPGRFLMPGDLEGTPLLTFAPLDVPATAEPVRNSIMAMMQQRYEAYVDRVVRPFFYDHFSRLDRQIVLVDVLSALNGGPAAIGDLKIALADVLGCFRAGSTGWLAEMFSTRIDRILFAATKADLLHHESHDRLEAVLAKLVEEAAGRAEIAGARIDSAALAAIRATREAHVKQDGELLPCIAGIPISGETIDGEIFDGRTEAAIFPGDLPETPAAAFDGSLTGELNFVRFRPPRLPAAGASISNASFPHIRLDRALEFLIGDQFA